MEAPSRRSRRWRFSLRALLLFVLLAAVAMAWVHRARRQHVAVEALRTSNPGATVLYDEQRPGYRRSESNWRAWARRQLGDDYVSTVTGAELYYTTDADLECLSGLPQLKWLSLVRSVDLTDAGLAHLGRLTSLETLILLDAEQVTDAGLRQLEPLKRLKRLRIDLGRHDVSEQVLQRLRRALPNCTIEVGEPREGESQMVAR
jgi:hypothetical protein